jgi:uncharacterized protein YndB with AHSA1/START domain
MSKRGHLLIADITGYTRFLTGSELDHAQGILETLFEVVLQRLKAPLVLSNIQGDAFFAFANDESVPMPGQILDSIEALYFSFRDRVTRMRENTQCTCRACRNVGDLDLKVILHHGEYVIDDIAGHHELTGPDVILLHRLLKNDVPARTGVKAYALITMAAAKELALDELKTEAKDYQTALDEFGVIEARVLDLGARWDAYRENNEIVVSEDEPLLFKPVTRAIPFGIDTVWEYLTDPTQRQRWQGVKKISRISGDPHRLRTGAVEHCAHGNKPMVLTFVDVRPLKHMTGEVLMPFGGKMRFSLLTAREEQGTRVTVRIAQPKSGHMLTTFLLRQLTGLSASKEAQHWSGCFEEMEALIRRSQTGDYAAAEMSAEELKTNTRNLAAA